MNENLTNIKNQVDKAVRKRRFRRLSRIFGVTFAVFMVAQFTLLYFANPILKSTIQSKIVSATQGVFTVDFDRISINISTFTVTLTNFKLTPNQQKYDSLKQAGLANKALYAVNFRKLEFKNIGLLRMLRTGNLQLNRIYIEKPLIRLLDLPFADTTKVLSHETTEQTEEDEKYDAVHNDLYPMIAPLLKSLKIKKVIIKEGYFDFYTGKKKQSISSTANKISIVLTNFFLDENAYKQRNKLFYSDDIDILVSDYIMGLKDNIHVIRAKEVGISTRNSRIVAKLVSMMPEKIKRRNLPDFNKNYFKAKLPQINIEGINITDIYFDKKVGLKRMSLIMPQIDIYKKEIKQKDDKKERKQIDVYELIKGKFAHLSVELFTLQNASINIRNNETDNDALTSIGNLTILLEKFYIDSLSHLNKSKILYADNIDLSLLNYRMKLKDNLHILTAGELLLSTESETILATNVSLAPKDSSSGSNYNVQIPRLEINGADFIKAFNYNELNIAELQLSEPTIDVRQLLKKAVADTLKHKHKAQKGNLSKMLEDYLKKVNIQRLVLNHADFDIGTFSPSGQKTTSNGLMTLKLYDFSFDSKSKNMRQNGFFARNFELFFSNYSSKLIDNLHELTVDSICLSSIDSTVYLKGMHFSPLFANTSISMLKNKKKSALMDISVAELRINNADLMSMYFDKKMEIDRIDISTPVIEMVSYPELKKLYAQSTDSIKIQPAAKTNEIQIVDTNILAPDTINTEVIGIAVAHNIDSIETDIRMNLADVAGNYFDIISIGKMLMHSGKIQYRNIDTLKTTNLVLVSDFRIELDSFRIDSNSLQNDSRLFFSENIGLDLNKYRLTMPNKIYDVKADWIKLSTKNREIRAKNFDLVPKMGLANKEKKSGILKIHIPELTFGGMDIKQATQNKILNAELVYMYQPEITLINRTQFKAIKPDSTGRKNFIATPKGLKLIDFALIELNGGKFILSSETDSTSNIVSQTAFGLKIDHFKLTEEGTKFDTKDIPFVDNVSLTLNDYSFELADSIHTVNVERFTISTADKSIDAEGIKLSHRNNQKPYEMLKDVGKSNLYDFNIEKFNITGLDYDKFYGEHKAEVDFLGIKNAQIEIDNFPDLKQPRVREPLIQKEEGQIFPSSIDFFKLLPPNLANIKANTLNFDNIDVSLRKHNDSEEDIDTTQLNRISGNISNLLIDENSYLDKNKFYSSDNIEFSIKDYKVPLDKSFSDIHIGKAGFSLSDSLIYVDDFVLTPRGGLANVASKYEFQKSISALDAQSIRMEGVEFKRLLEKKEMFAKKLLLDSVAIDFYKDKSHPEDKKAYKPLFQTTINNLKQFVKLDSVILKRSKIVYTENGVSNLGYSYITLDSVGLIVTNVTNDDVQQMQNNLMKADVKAYLMNQGKLDMQLLLDLTSKDSLYSLKGTISEMDLTLLNSYLQKAAFIEIKNGTLNSVDFDINGNDSISTGNVLMRYEDLKIGLLNREGDEGAAQAVYGLIANSLLRSANPRRKNLIPRQGPVYSIRVTSKSPVSQWIGAVLTGIKSTLGFQPRELRKQIREQKRKDSKLLKMKLLHTQNRSRWEKMREKEEKQLLKTKKKLKKQYKVQNKKSLREERRLQRKINRKMNDLLDMEVKQKHIK